MLWHLIQLSSERFLQISLVIFGVLVVSSACSPAANGTPSPIVEATNAATAVPPTTPTTQPAPTTPAPLPTVNPTDTAVPPTNIPTPTPQPIQLITADPVFTGGDMQFVEWSPDGRYLTYFEYSEEQVATQPVEGLRGTYPGTFVFYDTQTGEKCTDYPFSGYFSYEGDTSGALWRWLPDGRLLINAADGWALTNAPCEAGINISEQLGIPIGSLGSFSPDERWLILVGGQYWLYEWATGAIHTIPDVQPDAFNNLVWSPDSQHISITLAGNYTGDRSPIGGTRVIEVATGATIAQYDWEPANGLDGTFGGPVWISNEEFVVTLSLDQGPFFMNIEGEVRPLLPLFDETFDPEKYWMPIHVFADVANGRYAILRTNEGQPDAKLYVATPDGDSVVLFQRLNYLLNIYPYGELGYEENGRFWTRPVFENDSPFVEQPSTFIPWLPPNENEFTVTADTTTISLLRQRDGQLIERFQIAGYEKGFNIWPMLSPDEQWLAIFFHDPKFGLGKALFIISTPSE